MLNNNYRRRRNDLSFIDRFNYLSTCQIITLSTIGFMFGCLIAEVVFDHLVNLYGLSEREQAPFTMSNDHIPFNPLSFMTQQQINDFKRLKKEMADKELANVYVDGKCEITAGEAHSHHLKDCVTNEEPKKERKLMADEDDFVEVHAHWGKDGWHVYDDDCIIGSMEKKVDKRAVYDDGICRNMNDNPERIFIMFLFSMLKEISKMKVDVVKEVRGEKISNDNVDVITVVKDFNGDSDDEITFEFITFEFDDEEARNRQYVILDEAMNNAFKVTGLCSFNGGWNNWRLQMDTELDDPKILMEPIGGNSDDSFTVTTGTRVLKHDEVSWYHIPSRTKITGNYRWNQDQRLTLYDDSQRGLTLQYRSKKQRDKAFDDIQIHIVIANNEEVLHSYYDLKEYYQFLHHEHQENNYHIQKCVGKGTGPMAAPVFIVQQWLDGESKIIAVKVYKMEWKDKVQVIHENHEKAHGIKPQYVAQPYGVYTTDTILIEEMEYGATDAWRYFRSKSYDRRKLVQDTKRFAKAAVSVFKAFEEAERFGHNDFKPENVLFDDDKFKLIDFDMAETDDEMQSKEKSYKGTKPFYSPIQHLCRYPGQEKTLSAIFASKVLHFAKHNDMFAVANSIARIIDFAHERPLRKYFSDHKDVHFEGLTDSDISQVDNNMNIGYVYNGKRDHFIKALRDGHVDQTFINFFQDDALKFLFEKWPSMDDDVVDTSMDDDDADTSMDDDVADTWIAYFVGLDMDWDALGTAIDTHLVY